MRMALCNTLVLSIALTGCASTFETRPFSAADDGGVKGGVIYYESAPYLVRTEFRKYVKDGVLSEAACKPAQDKVEVQYHPGRKMVVIQHPSNFSSSSLTVALNANSTLASINASTTPVADKLLSTLELGFKDKVFADNLGGTPLCNTDPTIVLFQRIDVFADIPKLLGN